MARFGRGQPAAPIYLRGLAAIGIAATATGSPIHVFTAAPDREAVRPRGAFIYVRPNRASKVPDRLATPQITVISAVSGERPLVVHPAREADVLFMRAPSIPVVVATTPAPQTHVVLARTRTTRPTGRVVLRAPLPQPGAPQVHVVTARTHPPRVGVGILVRPSRSSFVPDRLAPQIHVVPVTRNPQRAAVRQTLTVVRPSRSSFVPDRFAPQITVVSAVQRRLAVHPSRDADVVFLRNPQPPPPVVTIGAPQIHVVSAVELRGAIHPAREADVIVVRAPSQAKGTVATVVLQAVDRSHVAYKGGVVLVRPSRAAVVPDRLAPQIHVVVVSRNPLRAAVRQTLTLVRPSRASFVPDRLAPQIHVVQVNPTSYRHPAREADVLFIRNPQAPVVTVAKAAPSTILLAQTLDRALPKTAVVVVRPSRTSFVPDRFAPQITVVSAVRARLAVHPSRDADVLFLRAPAVPPPPKPAVVVTARRPVVTQVERRASIRTGRTVPAALGAPQVHVVTTRQPVQRRPRGAVTAERIAAPQVFTKAPPPTVVLQAPNLRPHDRQGFVVFARRGPGVIGAQFPGRAAKIREVPDFVRLHQNLADPGTPTYYDGEYYFDGSIYYDGSVFGQAAADIADVVHARKLHEGPGGDFGEATYFDGTYDFDGVIDYDGGIKTGGGIRFKSTPAAPKARKLRDV